MSVEVLYRTATTATGGREGSAKSADGRLSTALSTPRELGGAGGEGTNPEQLFAAGYAACFLGALKLVAGQQKVRLPAEATITAHVGIGPRSEGGFGITADLEISLPGIAADEALRLAELAHQTCPYSNATRNNVAVGLRIV